MPINKLLPRKNLYPWVWLDESTVLGAQSKICLLLEKLDTETISYTHINECRNVSEGMKPNPSYSWEERAWVKGFCLMVSHLIFSVQEQPGTFRWWVRAVRGSNWLLICIFFHSLDMPVSISCWNLLEVAAEAGEFRLSPSPKDSSKQIAAIPLYFAGQWLSYYYNMNSLLFYLHISDSVVSIHWNTKGKGKRLIQPLSVYWVFLFIPKHGLA